MALVTIEVEESDLTSVIGMAQSYNDDLESGLKDGTYDEGNADENDASISRIEAALETAKRQMKQNDPMKFSIESYIRFLDSVIAECGPVDCLTQASNAVTRRAKASYAELRQAVLDTANHHGLKDVPRETFDELWPRLCQRQKYGILREDYAQPKTSAHDMRWPQDGRLVPGYAKDALAQLHTLKACVAEMAVLKMAKSAIQNMAQSQDQAKPRSPRR